MSLLSIKPRKFWCNQQRASRRRQFSQRQFSRRQFSQRRSGKVIGGWLLLLGAILSLGCGLFLLAPTGGHLAALPITPLGDLAQHIGTGKIVRVQARLVSDPTVIGPEGQSLALQRLQVEAVSSAGKPETTEPTPTATEPPPAEQETAEQETAEQETAEPAAAIAPDTVAEIAYDETVPGLVWASDGADAVAVDPADFDPEFVHESATAEVEDKDVVPAAIRIKLSPEFDDVPAPLGAVMRLWHIEQGANVTIIGEVGEEEGQPILHAPESEHKFIISPLTIEEIVERAGSPDTAIRALGWALIILGVVLGIAAFAGTRRKTRGNHAPVE